MGKVVRSRLGRWIVGLGVAAALLAGLALAAGLLVRAYAPAISRERLEAALADALGRPVSIESVALSVWLGRAEIRNVRVGPSPGEGSEPILHLGRGELRVGISSLWRRQLVLSTILLEDVSLRLSGSSQAAPSPVLDIPETLEVGPVTVHIGTLRIERGNLLYRDEARGLTAEVRELRATARPARRGIDVRLSLAAFSLQTPDVRETLTEVEGSGWIHQDLVSITTLAGRWQDRPLRVAGEIRHPFTAADFTLRVQGEVDLAQVSQRIKPAWPLAGVATTEVDVRGLITAPQISGQLSVPNLTAGPIQARAVAIRGQWSQAETDLQVRTDVDLALLGAALKTGAPLSLHHQLCRLGHGGVRIDGYGRLSHYHLYWNLIYGTPAPFGCSLVQAVGYVVLGDYAD